MAASNWLYNFAISQATPHMFLKMGYGVYLFFASCMVVSVIWVYFLMPETKGIPVEEMDNLHERRPIRHANKLVMEELRIKAAERSGQAVLSEYPSDDTSSTNDDKAGMNEVKVNTA